ncbi:hypothetical protein SO802_018344 [Lithocarpus litseifolius]|uniref:RNase H type-1 domain-containing protein n=1 Tax=Lithocarpus litseifolius TaxID=425828 RepID=A0AAW2CM45_9ROSI
MGQFQRKGEAVAGLCKLPPGNFNVTETEALAVEAGVLLAKELGLQQVILESDSLLVVLEISSKDVSGETGSTNNVNLDCRLAAPVGSMVA